MGIQLPGMSHKQLGDTANGMGPFQMDDMFVCACVCHRDKKICIKPEMQHEYFEVLSGCIHVLAVDM
jgi:hypothetical protein